MKLRPLIVACALGLVAVPACSHSVTSSPEAAPSPKQKDVVIPPRMTGSARVGIRSIGGPPRGTVEVPIDVTGRPDVFGMRYLGTFSEMTKRDIADYISQARFAPGTRNGIPERGVFKMTFN
jgi:hypothetical protein